MASTCEVKMMVGSNGEAANVFGNHDQNLRFIENNCAAKIVARGNELIISGEREAVDRTRQLFQQLIALARSGTLISVNTINYALKVLEQQSGETHKLAKVLSKDIYVTPEGKAIRPRTLGQERYVQAMQENDLVFGIGPAGTGKTYLAVVMAVAALRSKQVNRIVLARPAVEAGEKLGFLPGDLQEKVNPYLRPLYDGLYDVLGVDTAKKYVERALIEVAPLAYMRGRTLGNAFIILDEAQNTTPEQMKMFLTRIGLGSRAVVIGDITQIDLPPGQVSGLVDARKVLKDVDGISIQLLTEADVVRHPLVQKIVQAYDRRER